MLVAYSTITLLQNAAARLINKLHLYDRSTHKLLNSLSVEVLTNHVDKVSEHLLYVLSL
jgi:hypothetical protein